MHKQFLLAIGLLVAVQLPLAIAQDEVEVSADRDQARSEKVRRGPPPFAKLDLDGSGGVSLEEFQQHRLPRGDHQTVFARIDADGDGLISETELASRKSLKKKKGQKNKPSGNSEM